MIDKTWPISSGQGELVRCESLCLHTSLIVVAGDGWAEWGIVTDGKIVAESNLAYGGISAALRDGLLFAECDMILNDPDANGDWELRARHEWIREYPKSEGPTYMLPEVSR